MYWRMQPRLILRQAVARSYRRQSEVLYVLPDNLLNRTRIGPCDVTSKEDLEKLVQEISKKEKHLNLLSTHILNQSLKSLAPNTIQSQAPASQAPKLNQSPNRLRS